MYRLSTGGPFGMVFEHFCNSFGLKKGDNMLKGHLT
jgi:hypothetical protein